MVVFYIYFLVHHLCICAECRVIVFEYLRGSVQCLQPKAEVKIYRSIRHWRRQIIIAHSPGLVTIMMIMMVVMVMMMVVTLGIKGNDLGGLWPEQSAM